MDARVMPGYARASSFVLTGLGPVIHGLEPRKEDVDARVMPAQDDLK